MASFADVEELVASVDKNKLLVDESIRLTLIATGSASRDDADFSVLQSNFRLSRPSFSQSTQIINGDMTRTVSWSLNLYPKSVGKFEIPAFEIDGARSRPFSVEVLPLSASASTAPREFFVDATVSNADLYLQQQLLYTIKIHLARDIQRGNLGLPELEGAIIEQIGEDKDYQELQNGIRYRIIERNYAIIPQSSGDFTIKGPIFEAEILTNSRQSFANFGRTTTITRRAPDVQIKVAPIPDGYAYTWLPSEAVEVSEEWQGNIDELRVGEPITRTITLTALGLTKEQLPQIDGQFHPSFKTYPEQPNLANAEHNNKLVAQGVYNTAIIPSEAGSFVLPEVSVPWFNVNTGETEFARIPAKSVKVLPASLSNNASDKPSKGQDIQQEQDETPNKSSENTAMSEPAFDRQEEDIDTLHWVLISSNLLSIVLLLILMLLLKKYKAAGHSEGVQQRTVKKQPLSDEPSSFALLKKQLESGQIHSISAHLDKWLRALLGEEHKSISLSLSKGHDKRALMGYNQVLANQYSKDVAETNAKDLSSEEYRAFIDGLCALRSEKLQSAQNMYSRLYPTSG